MEAPMAESTRQIISLLEEAYASRTNNLKQSRDLAEQALRLSHEIDNKALIGKCLSQLSLYAMIQGEYESSMSMSEEAIKYFEELNDERGKADAKYNIAGVYYKTDNFHLGLTYLIDCQSIYRKFNDYHNQARVEKSLGTIYEYFGDERNAIKAYEAAIEAAKKAGDVNLESNAYNPLSGIYLKKNQVEKALDVIELAIEKKKKTGDIRGLAFSYYGRAKVYSKLKRFKEAERDYLESISIHREMGEKLGLGMAYCKLGGMYIDMGELDQAKAILATGLKFGFTYNIAIVKFKCNYHFYQIYKKEGDAAKALEYLERYLEQKEAVINTQTLKVIENYDLISKMESLQTEARLQVEKADIIDKKNRAEQTAQVKQEFLSTMSHEIRTPLNAVITIASLLGDKVQIEERQLVDSLKFAANNLLLIINDILDFTKLETGKTHLEMRPANFILLLENIKNTYQSLAKEKGLPLNLKIDREISGNYLLDETKFSQIVSNLVTNAIKFTDSGEVNIEIDKLYGEDETDTLRFRIIDTGIGIDEKHLEDIFDSFSQPQSITTRKQGGSGLGLAIVKKLVELYGSTIKVTSEVGQGSVFYFDLQLKKSASPGIVAPPNTDELKNKTVLLAEDNMINAMVAKKLLSNWKMTTDHVVNGLEAVEKSNRKKYDYILMDIHMPEMNGFEATKSIRQGNGYNSGIPIFALTADITAAQEEGYGEFFNGFLTKPIEINKLFEALINAV